MNTKTNRRRFIKMAAISGAGMGLANAFSPLYAGTPARVDAFAMAKSGSASPAFIPNRAASWWCTIEDLQWPQKHVTEKIKRRAAAFAKAGIDTAINFGFHNRFDFANYFSQLHGYYANVCAELHSNGVKFMDHYSCNDITRPRNESDFRYLHKYQRHSVLLFPDQEAARHAQYAGYFYDDLCEIDLRDGKHGYASQYMFEAFCHNNPNFRDMHRKYLQRLLKEVPLDGVEVDDMCSYPGNTTCACKYCRDRFRQEYGHEIPAFSDKTFFGDTSKEMLEWGNYDNPAYRDWLRMKAVVVTEHVKMIKEVIGDKPLMTCCSNTGPIVLNAVALDLERMAPYLDFFMLENVGTNTKNVEWIEMDAEALLQKDIAKKQSDAPAIALSYAIFKKGAYFGWALARFWGVSNWSSTLNSRLEEDPANALEGEDAIGDTNNWEKQHSNLDYRDGEDLVEVRLVNNGYCRENGWRDESGHEHWDRSKAWSGHLVMNNVGYRFVRGTELEDASSLLKESTPLIMDGVGCISEKQFAAIKHFLSKGGTGWVALPFGTHDEKGFVRKQPLSIELLKGHFKNLVIIESAIAATPLQTLVREGKFKPAIRQLKGDQRWVVRARSYKSLFTLHFLNTGLRAIADEVDDLSGIPLMKDIDSLVTDNQLAFEIDTAKLPLSTIVLRSPELPAARAVNIARGKPGKLVLYPDLEGVKIYAIAQPGAG